MRKDLHQDSHWEEDIPEGRRHAMFFLLDLMMAERDWQYIRSDLVN